ncbi:MAG: PA domain-containing protein, partial [Planctomycetota bacterium]
MTLAPKLLESRKFSLPLAACLGLLAALPAVDVRPEKAASPQGDLRAFQQHLEALTAEEMAGRGTGSPGGMRAIAYIERRMRALGLRGLPGLVREYRQELSLPDPRPIEFDLRSTGLSWMDGSGEISSRRGAALPFRFSPDADLERQLVFVGYGLKIPELGIDEYAGLDVAGKIVLVLRGAPGKDWRSSPYRADGDALKFSSKIANAAAAGAAGFLLVGESVALDEDQEDALVRRALRARGESSLPALWITRPLGEELLVCSGLSLSQRQAGIDRQLESLAAGGQQTEQSSDLRGLVPALRCRLRVSMAGP